jgi:hypothetical protein
MAKDGYIFWCSKCKVDHAGECQVVTVAKKVYPGMVLKDHVIKFLDSVPVQFIVCDSLVPNGEAFAADGVLCVSEKTASEWEPADTDVDIYGRKFKGWKLALN